MCSSDLFPSHDISREINLQTSDVVLLKNSLVELGEAIAIGRKTIKESWNNKGDYSKSITTQTAE